MSSKKGVGGGAGMVVGGSLYMYLLILVLGTSVNSVGQDR